jgi:hypothetical protein
MRITRRIFTDWRGLATAGVAVAALATTAGLTLGGFSATIANPTNTFSSGTIQLSEGNGVTTCYSTGTGSGGSVTAGNSGTCSIIDDLGGTLDQVPAGTALTTTLTLKNVGNVATTAAALVTSTCTSAAASDSATYVGGDASYCGKVDVTIANTTSGAADACVFPTQIAACPGLSSTNTLASLASTTFGTTPMSALAAGASATYVIKVQLDGTTATNADQGLTATIPLTWSITQ